MGIKQYENEWVDGDALNSTDLLDSLGRYLPNNYAWGSKLLDDATGDTVYAAPTNLTADVYADTITIDTGVTVTSQLKCVYLIARTITLSGTAVLTSVGYGAAGGAAGVVGGVNAGSSGSNGMSGGGGGGATSAAAGGDGGASDLSAGGLGGTTGSRGGKAATYGIADKRRRFGHIMPLGLNDNSWGSGGGGGASNASSGTAGAGGIGGGTIVLICDTLSVASGASILASGAAGGNGTGNGCGGGGAGAGAIIIIAKTLSESGTLTANGGNGGNSGGGAGTEAGGAGANGGFILIFSSVTAANPYTTSVTAGTGGTGDTAGENGNAGLVVFKQIV